MASKHAKKSLSGSKAMKKLLKDHESLFSSPVMISRQQPLDKARSISKSKREVFITAKDIEHKKRHKIMAGVREASKCEEDKRVKKTCVNSEVVPCFLKEPEKEKPQSIKQPRIKLVIQPCLSKDDQRLIVGKQEGKLPTITLKNAPSDATEVVVVTSCVTAEEPFKSHPFRIDSNDGSAEQGVVSRTFKRFSDIELAELSLNPTLTQEEVNKSIEERIRIRVDPFQQGFSEDDEFDKDVFRICFQVFLKLKDGTLRPVDPIVSEVLRLKLSQKPKNVLEITDISDQEVPLSGQTEICVICQHLSNQNDIKVIIEQKDEVSGEKVWSCSVKSPNIRIHSGSKLSFKTPPFHDLTVSQPVRVKFCLFRQSDKAFSKSFYLWYMPDTFWNPSSPLSPSSSSSSSSSTMSPALTVPRRKSHMKAVEEIKADVDIEEIPQVEMTFSMAPLPMEPMQLAETKESSLKLSLNLLTRDLEMERASNRYLAQRNKSLKLDQDSLHSMKINLERDLDAMKLENLALRETNTRLLERANNLEQELDSWRKGSSVERIISHLQDEIRSLQDRVEGLTIANQQMKSNQAIQSRGVANMRWQLQQKESLIKALECKLEETYPILDGQTDAGFNHSILGDTSSINRKKRRTSSEK